MCNLNTSKLEKSFKVDQGVKELVDKFNLISCSGFHDKKIKLWNISDYECIKEFFGHSNSIYNLQLSLDWKSFV